MPGMLIPADLGRLIPDGANVMQWAEANLLASPGALVSKSGKVFRIPTLVPAVKSDGSCIHFSEKGCAIHEESPFGCAFFDCGPTPTGLAESGLSEIARSMRDPYSLYRQIWIHLATIEQTQLPPETLRARMRRP